MFSGTVESPPRLTIIFKFLKVITMPSTFQPITHAEYKSLRSMIYNRRYQYRRATPKYVDERYDCFITLIIDGERFVLCESTVVNNSKDQKTRSLYFKNDSHVYHICPLNGFSNVKSSGWQVLDISSSLPARFISKVLST